MPSSASPIVVQAFSPYAKGQSISDGVTIASILAGPYASYVVAVNASLSVVSGGVPTIAAGIDSSWNAPALPAGSPLQTIALNPVRQNIEINNPTDQDVILALDDGNDGALSLYPLAAGGANKQGGNWSSLFFKGRIQIFSASGVTPNGYVYVHQD